MQRFLVSACLLGACSVVAFAQGPPEGPFRPAIKGPIRLDGLPPHFLQPPKANDSHQPRPGEEQMPDIRDLLLGNKTPNDIDPKLLQDLMNKLPKDQKFDPKQVENLLKNNPQFRDPEFLKQLQKMLDAPDFAKNLQQQLGDGPKPKLDNIGDLANKFGEVVKQGKDPNLGNLEPLNPNPLNPNNLPNNPLDNQALNNDWVKWFDKSFGDSALTKDLAKDIADALGNKDLQGLMKEFPELNSKEWKDFGDWTKLNLKPGDLPDFKMGGSSNNSGGGSTFNGFGGGSTGGGSSGGGGGDSVSLSQGTVTALLVGLCVLAALIGALVFYRKYKLDQEHQAALAALGHAGLDLAQIRTREELVAAFEAVTLERIGDDARNWNHRVIADQFAESEPTHTEPANELAGLYERARYAPEDENLAPHEYADARRDLTTIAGANA